MTTNSDKIVVTLKKAIHHKMVVLLIAFKYHTPTIQNVKRIARAKWSQSLKCWFVPFSDSTLREVKHVLNNRVVLKIDVSVGQTKPFVLKPIIPKRVLAETQITFIKNYEKYLYGLRLSESTVRTYSSFISDFLVYVGVVDLTTLNNIDVSHFVEDVVVVRQYSISTHRQIVSAIKHFKSFVPNSQINELNLTRPHKSLILPTVLSKEEVIDLLRCTRNLKHRAILALIYSAGLRISEMLHLKLSAIDIDRRQIIVKNSKGRKDRHIILAESFIPLLYNYLQSYQPKVYFVEGKPQEMYSAESVRGFLKRSCQLAKITKHVTPHTLRHSYATHLLENGIDIRYIQELLGHAKPETTMIYTHVSKKDLLKIESPLDLALKDVIENDKQDKILLLSRNINR